MFALFYADCDDPKNGIPKGPIIAQVEKMIAETIVLDEKVGIWLDPAKGQDAITLHFDGEYVTQIAFRFDTRLPNPVFQSQVIRFVQRNNFQIHIKQSIIFDATQLTAKLISLNNQSSYETEDPIAFLLNQRKL